MGFGGSGESGDGAGLPGGCNCGGNNWTLSDWEGDVVSRVMVLLSV